MKTTLATKCSVSPSTIVIRYIQVIQRQLLDAVGSSHSLSVLLSAMETSNTTQTALALARWPIIRNYSNSYGCAEYSSHSYYSKMGFILLLIVWLQFEGGTVRGWHLFEEVQYLSHNLNSDLIVVSLTVTVVVQAFSNVSLFSSVPFSFPLLHVSLFEFPFIPLHSILIWGCGRNFTRHAKVPQTSNWHIY